MIISVLRQAADEFDEATAHYEEKQLGLGKRFRDEVDRHIGWIAEHGQVPRLRSGGYRRVNLRVFPYYIAYLQIGETIWILAIAHAHREPEYWIERKDGISQTSAPPNGGPGIPPEHLEGTEGPPSVS